MADLASALLAGTRKRKFHELLAQQAASTEPTAHWGASLARALQGGMAGLMERGERDSDGAEFDKLFGPQASAQPQQTAKPTPTLATALSGDPAPQRTAGVQVIEGNAETQPSPLDPPSGNTPRGYRNNNPLNIESGKFTQGQPGFSGSDGRFAKFESMDQGVGAANKLLDVYQNKHGLNTVSGIVGRWAPAGDGNNVSAYAANVAKQLGIDPNTPIPPEMRQPLIAAMAKHENGRPMPQTLAYDPAQPPAVQNLPYNPAERPPVQMAQDQGALPPGAQPAQGPLPPQIAPQQTRVAPQIPQHILGQARKLWQDGDRAAAGALMQPYLTPKDQWELEPSPIPGDNNMYQRNRGSNERKPLNPQPFAVNVNNQAESKFSEKAGELQAKRFDELAGDAPSAKQMQSDVAMLRDLGDKIRTGKIAEVKAVIGPYADALGIKVEGLSEIQAFEAVLNRVAPQLRVKGTGAQSDFELRNFLKQMPSIGNTPEGNALIEKTMQGFIQNKITAAEIGSAALTGEINRKEAEKRLRDLPDPMAEWREYNKKVKADAPAVQVIDGYKIRAK
jgi:hypothetical protein